MQMALARDADGSVRGLACWKVDGGFEQHRPAGVLDLVELVGVDTAAEARLWRFVCEIDLVTTVRQVLGTRRKVGV